MAAKNIDSHRIAHQRLIEALKQQKKFIPKSADERDWHAIINALPTNMQEALLHELEKGNSVTALQMDDWPHIGSIVVSLADKFKGTYGEGNRYGVTFRLMNDPHYWIANIHQVVNGTEHLIIY